MFVFAFFFFNSVIAENASVKLIVKITPDNFKYVESVLQEYGFTLYRKIIDGIYTFESEDFVGDAIKELIFAAMRTNLGDQVEYMYESYDLLRPPPTTWEDEDLRKPTYRTGTISALSKDYQVCSPVYDPMFGIDDAWQRNITGNGVVIAITDVGTDNDQPTLRYKINFTISRTFTRRIDRIHLNYSRNNQRSAFLTNHGNACAGLAAGFRNKSTLCQTCGCGIAPDATIAALKVGFVPEIPQPTIDLESLCSSLEYRYQDIDIYSNSWNFNYRTPQNDTCIVDSLKRGFYKGRNCKGNIYVFPADPPGNGFVNNIYTIAVGDIGINGTLPKNPQVNSAVTVCMFGAGRKKHENRLVIDAHRSSLHPCSDGDFGRQSFASAMASGVIALLLEVNKNLTARDVKHILIESASNKGIAEESSFKENSAGYLYHKVIGFGYPDVTKMITLAKNWTSLSDLKSNTFKFDIIGNTSLKNIQTGQIGKLEDVVFEVEFYIPRYAFNLTIKATSPSSTTSILLENASLSIRNNKLKLLSKHFWGEAPNGNWTLTATANFSAAKVTLYGTGDILYETLTMFNQTDARVTDISQIPGVLHTIGLFGCFMLCIALAGVCLTRQKKWYSNATKKYLHVPVI